MKALTLPAIAMVASVLALGGTSAALADGMSDTMPRAGASAPRQAAPARQAMPRQAREAAVDELNAQSLERARANQNSPSGQPDTTGNLNRMSDQDAQRGVNTGQQPMVPFR